MTFLKPVDLVHYPPAEQSKVAGIRRDFYICDPIDYFIPDRRNNFFRPSFSFASPSLSVNDIISLPPFLEHFCHQFGWILQIDVHDDDGVAAGVLETCQGGHRLTETSGKTDQFDPFILRAGGENLFLRSVR